NWIGRSEGVEITFKVADSEETLTVYILQNNSPWL
ncbi:hypothetical protein CE195_01725, partial [Sodalis-like symbiont of Philaenus spumarius]